MTGKRMTLGELAARSRAEMLATYEERLAWEATPEGKAWVAAREAEARRLMEADIRFAEENPPDWFEEGRLARNAGDKREPPEDLDDEAADAWLDGYDSEGEDE